MDSLINKLKEEKRLRKEAKRKARLDKLEEQRRLDLIQQKKKEELEKFKIEENRKSI